MITLIKKEPPCTPSSQEDRKAADEALHDPRVQENGRWRQSELAITPAQLRAARALLGWPRKQLRTQSGVSVETLKNIERGKNRPAATTFERLVSTFANHGVTFVNNREFEAVFRVRAAEASALSDFWIVRRPISDEERVCPEQ